MKLPKYSLLPILFWALLPFCLSAQDEPSPTENLRDDAVKVFIDCNWGCDMNYIKNNILMVNYMRDVTDAEVYIRVAELSTGSGGSEYTLFFEGQGRFEGQKNEIKYNIPAVSTNDEQRNEMVKHLKAGLLPFVAQTPMFERVSIAYQKPTEESAAEEQPVDKWDNWVYSISVNGWLNGQASAQNLDAFANLSAQRVTEDWKIRINANGSLNLSRFIISSGEGDNTIVSKIFNYGGSVYAIRAINDHWSAGGVYRVNSSSFRNIRLSHRKMAAVEYNLFPYEEATDRQLRFSYMLGGLHNSYLDTTIYNKTQEYLGLHSLGIAYETQSKWGSVDISLRGNQYLHDLSLYNVRLFSGINVRVVKGLSVRLSGSVSWIRDQIALRKGGATEEDVLLQQQELATNYSYFGNFGLRYTFGSTFNNVVFPRFGGGL